jgi:hypothetical protein
MIRPMRVLLGVVLALATAGAAAAAPAQRAWPGAVIGYRDLTGAHGYHAAVRAAVAAWNRLGLGVRFVPAPAGASAVQIVFSAGRCVPGVAGHAPTGFQRFGARVVVRSCPPVVRPLLVAHELGRVLGLGNDDRTCSLMNSKGRTDGRTFAAPARCARAVPPAWLPRLVDPLTAARARTLYAPPTAAVAVRFTPAPQPRLDWRQPAGSSIRTLVLRTSGRCPVPADVAGSTGAVVVYAKTSYRGLHWAVDAAPGGEGSVCYRLFNVSASGRTAPSATFTFAPAPVAAAAVTSGATAGAPVAFADRSTGAVVRWRWDFGDPSSGAANVLDTADPALGRAPTHTYAAAGTYTVTLTVSDGTGRSAGATVSVTVA